MIEAGLLREVRGLRGRGYAADLKPMQSIGYRHIQAVVDGSDTLANALESIKVDTRRFARRQRTWIRPLPNVHWHDPSDPEAIFERVRRFLETTDAGREAGSSSGPSRYPAPP
jgi:tRNA dimethylallyltransferase